MSKIACFNATKHFCKAAILLVLQNPADSTEKPDRKAEEGQNNQLKYIQNLKIQKYIVKYE